MNQDDLDKRDDAHEDEQSGELEVPEHEKSVHVTKLSGMYRDWFLEYASYVILERAVPHLDDGLKPVQRRILHSMRRMDDGRYNKVANIIGHTMQFHPHGDASIGDALVQLGQKDLLIDTQGNWGNILTGDGSAAPRYIEARLTKFASEVVFNPKTTEWKASYDGRNKEPLTLPVKFPLLLAQGVEGIAVGLASKILPHNFIELIDASIAQLKGQSFNLYPDFPTGGMVDVSKYNDGLRGGSIKVRAKINKADNKTLSITELPFGKTTGSLIETIIKANDKGKIKVKRIDDNTASDVEILVHLSPGISPDVTIDALYAFTDCEVSISPNACIINEDKPHFIGVSEILRYSTEHTKQLLKQELEIRLDELEDEWHKSSLEKIFIEERMYKEAGYENSESRDQALDFLEKAFAPYLPRFRRNITRDDLSMLFEIKMGRILKYNTLKADELIRGIEDEIEIVKVNLGRLVDYTIDYFKHIRTKYGKDKERKTEIKNFDTIEAVQVAVANEKLYINRAEGFIGTGLRKEEFVCDCSDIDDIIVIRRDGKYLITKVAEKTYAGKDILFAGVYLKSDKRTIYNVVYRDGLNGAIYAKRCSINSLTRDKEYDLGKGSEGSRILHLSVNPNGEAEVLKVTLKPRPRLRNLSFDYNFSELAIKGRSSMGNILTRYAIHKISVKEQGESTLGGLKVWFDESVNRLNGEGRGRFVGEFIAGDRLVVFYKSGVFITHKPEFTLHFDEDILQIEKWNEDKIYTVIYFDEEQNFYYLKRFTAAINGREQNYFPEDTPCKYVSMSEEKFPQFKLIFGGKHKDRDPELIDADEFIAVKGYKAKGKRLTTYDLKTIEEIEPLQKEDDEPLEDDASENPNNIKPDFDRNGGTGEQMSLGL